MAAARPTVSPSNGGGALVVTLGEIVLIHDLKRQGLSVSAIARKLGLDRKTVRRHLDRGMEPPAYGPRPALSGPAQRHVAAGRNPEQGSGFEPGLIGTGLPTGDSAPYHLDSRDTHRAVERISYRAMAAITT